MKKLIKTPVKYGLFGILICFITCKGPQGDVGPQGVAGPTGQTGLQGPQGPQGVANLITSAWTMVKATDWKSDNDPQYFYIKLEDKNITQAVVDKGVVMAYYRNPAHPAVVLSMPSVTDKLSVGYFFLVDQGKGYMNFDLSFFIPRKVPIDFDTEFRWVIIPPNPGGRLAAVDWQDYEAVKRALNLID
ncbi:hypothetical protein [Spirosoma gilvum]